MNERIDQLLVKAGAYFGGEGVDYSNFDPKKFAELIVRECIDKIETHRIPVGNSAAGEMACEWTYAALIEIRDEIKQHFGVGEQVTEPVELHSCPYAEELYGNYDKICECDEERTRQCAMNV